MHYLVVGLGVTGLSVIKYLRDRGNRVTVTDSRYNPPQLQKLFSIYPNTEVFLGKIYIPEYVTTVVLSPGVALTDPALDAARYRGLEIIGDIELFAREVTKPVYAVTGSNGKSTVTTLLGRMAAASGIKAGVGGNLGTAALDLLDSDNECYILELSSFQLETTSLLQPKAVTILNISPDHMDRYQDLEAYKRAKHRIYINAQHAVFNRADSLTVPLQHKVPHCITFGLDAPQEDNYGVLEIDGVRWLAKGSEPLMPIKQMGMLGDHNVANALTALAIGEIAGFGREAMLKTLREFTGLEHRCEKIAHFNEVVWINDSKGTNVGATVTAIEGLAKSISGKWIIILGGIGKNADFEPLKKPVAQHCKAAILIGDEQQKLLELLQPVTQCFTANNMQEVVSLAHQNSEQGDGILLSPACASFDMFENYAHRGEQFKHHVLQWIEKHNATAKSK